MTEEQAVKLAASEFWKELTPRQIAELLCMPFDVFHEAIEKALGRSVWTHEFAFGGLDRMKAELLGERPAPTFADILALIPEEKRLLLVVMP
jgi:hypothetical protein